MPTRTLTLTERAAAECRLAPKDVEFLLERHRAHLQVAPAGQRGRFRLTATGHVGTIVSPGCRLVIRPKIPVRSLFHLLDPSWPTPVTEDYTATEDGTGVLDFLAGRLARLMAELAAVGLHRAYVERSDSGPFLQGRLDIAAQLREGNARKDRIHCRYEELTADVPCNQVPKATAELVLGSPLLGDAVRSALRRSLRPFERISCTPLNADSFAAASAIRLVEVYRPLLDLCRLLVESLQPGKDAGSVPCPAFLLDMEKVFENYVTRGILDAYTIRESRSAADGGMFTVSVQSQFAANRPVPGRRDILMRPDIVIHRGRRPVVVVDAKWKRGVGPAFVPEDLYQALAYATALGAPRAVLVYPGRRDRAWKYTLARAPVCLEVRTLRVVGSRDECAASLARLAHCFPGPRACPNSGS